MTYVFIVKLALSNKSLQNSKLMTTFPRASDAVLTSREFKEYRLCVAACKELMDNQAVELTSIAGIDGKFNVAWESNPFIDGRFKDMSDTEKELHNKIWDKGEVMKMFAINPNLKDETDKMIAAISGSIVALSDQHTRVNDSQTTK